MPTVLDHALLTDTLRSLPGWEGGPDRIWREVQVTPEEAEKLQREVGVDADAMGHHPTIQETGGGLRFELATADSNGVTELDIALAAHISDLIHRVTGQPGIDAVRHGAAVVTVRAADEDYAANLEERGAEHDSVNLSDGPESQTSRRPMSTGAGAAMLVDDDPSVPDPDMPLLDDRP